ncbi:hypothetical protein CIW52_28125 [Mycolicibacterium sp. P9-64]|nr:hypothetical protein CIW52_28125 [Mycolicibacterium sp. P9-64]
MTETATLTGEAMCYAEKCPKCGRTGWAGCGQHVDEVMRSIPVSRRCTCDRDSAPKRTAIDRLSDPRP